MQEAAARGYRYVTADAGEMSAPIVLRNGFELLIVAQGRDWMGHGSPYLKPHTELVHCTRLVAIARQITETRADRGIHSMRLTMPAARKDGQ